MKSTTCKKCGQQIVWFRIASQFVAVDAELVEAGDDNESYDQKRHGTHWGNCKKAAKPCGYIKPEGYPTQPLSPEAIANSQFLRAIPDDEEQRISEAIERR